jgi:hypothetical protein
MNSIINDVTLHRITLTLVFVPQQHDPDQMTHSPLNPLQQTHEHHVTPCDWLRLSANGAEIKIKQNRGTHRIKKGHSRSTRHSGHFAFVMTSAVKLDWYKWLLAIWMFAVLQLPVDAR